jgi:acyl-CoA thioesterase I
MLARRSIIVLLAVLFVAAPCLSGPDAARPSEKTEVACVGDSITFGGGPRDGNSMAYPFQMQLLLGDGYLVRNFGVSGATLLKKGDHPYVATDQYLPAREFQPDIVVIKLGTNDSKPQNWKHREDYVKDYLELIDSFAKLKSSPKIYVCYPVPAFPGDWGISDEVIREEIKPLVDEVLRLRKDVNLIDLYTEFSGRPELFRDKVHPTAAGYRKLAEFVAGRISDRKDGGQ